MKKVFLSLAVLASVAMVSCGPKANNDKAEGADSTKVENNDSVNTAAPADSVAAPADSVAAPADSVA